MPLLAVLIFDKDKAVCEAALEVIGSAQPDYQDFAITIKGLLKILEDNNEKLQLKTMFIFRDAIMSPHKMLQISDYDYIFKNLLTHKFDKLPNFNADFIHYKNWGQLL